MKPYSSVAMFYHKRYQAGQHLTRAEAIIAKCYYCTDYSVEGIVDCKLAVCPLYAWRLVDFKKKGP